MHSQALPRWLTLPFAVAAYLVFGLPLALWHAFAARRRLRASGLPSLMPIDTGLPRPPIIRLDTTHEATMRF